jgi:hypothetical protein
MGWVGNVLILTGAWRLSKKHRDAFLFGLSGDICWMIEAASIQKWDLFAIEATLFCIAIRNFCIWGRDARIRETTASVQ